MPTNDLAGWMRWRTRRRASAAAVPGAAQGLYRDLVRGALSPAFRTLGFSGSGGRYSLPADGCWALLGLQKSVYSDRQEVRFTANLLVANRATWASLRAQMGYLPERPAPSTLYGDKIAQSRIGDLLPDAADTWWRIYAGVDLDAVGQDVITSIERYGLPWLRREMARHGCG